MHFVYIIKSIKQRVLYIGVTGNIQKRLAEHNSGKSSHTAKYMLWKPVYIEGYANEEDAYDREQRLKQFGKVHSQLKRRIMRSLQS